MFRCQCVGGLVGFQRCNFNVAHMSLSTLTALLLPCKDIASSCSSKSHLEFPIFHFCFHLYSCTDDIHDICLQPVIPPCLFSASYWIVKLSCILHKLLTWLLANSFDKISLLQNVEQILKTILWGNVNLRQALLADCEMFFCCLSAC